MIPRLAIGLAALAVAVPGTVANTVGSIEINGAIGPATAGYIERAVRVSGERGDSALIIRLDTPGGLLDSTKEIVQTFYASDVPVVVYVAPEGANAGSAGVFITMAADIAAMAPNTSIGAAHPVVMGGMPGGDEGKDDTMKQKLENFAASYIAAIAEKRGRDVKWAESAVRESASITSSEALKKNVVDLIAANTDELLAKIDGRDFRGSPIHTAGAKLEPIPMVLRERVFQMLWRPEVMFVLMLVAIYGLIGELSSPGAILPGVAGAIALVLALYMGAVLPVNIAGIALIVLAVGLFVIDAMAPTHGVLTTGGIISFFLGAIMLFDSAAPAFRLSLSFIIPATLITAAFFIFVVGAGIRAQRQPAKLGPETMKGRGAVALSEVGADGGHVLIDGEDWRAVSDAPVPKGGAVEILEVKGLSLVVRSRTKEESNE